MKAWIVAEYLSVPGVLCSMYRENLKKPVGIVEEKIQFGRDKYQYIMTFRPLHQVKKNTVMFLHGGAWAAGSPEGFAFIGRFFSRLGYNTILGGYRHAPKYKYPAQLEDVCSGLTEGIKAMERQGVFNGRLIVAGHSSGAHLGALMVLDKENAIKQGIDPSVFSAMILISGPVDFSVCKAKQIKIGFHGFLRSEKDYANADPIKMTGQSAAIPVMCIHGAKDPVVDIKNSINFYNKVKTDTDGMSKLVIAKTKHHLDLLGIFMKNTEVTEAIIGYLNQVEKM